METILFGGEPKPLHEKLRPLAAELAEAIVGSYKSRPGHTLVVEQVGATVLFRLHWVRPKGAVTRGTIGAAGNGKLMINHGTGVDPITVERDAGQSVRALVWSGTTYRRE